jgi:DnaJ-class molecular chaperone
MNTDGNIDALNRRLHEIEEYEARMITCPECDGDGVCAYEEAVVDYVNGGYLKEVIDTCERCDGAGEIEIEGDE